MMTKDIKVAEVVNPPMTEDETFKRENIQRFIKTVEEVGDCMKEARKTAKTTNKYLWMVIIMMVVMVGGSIGMMAYRSGSIEKFVDNMFGASVNVNQRIVCRVGNESVTYNAMMPEYAYYFKQVFGRDTECVLTSAGDVDV